MLYKTVFVVRCLVVYSDELYPDFIYSLFSVRPGDASGRRLLSLMGNSLRDFWVALGNAILEAVESIFVAEWGEFTRLVPLESGEESSSTVLCGRDFINACNKAGVPVLAISVVRRRARVVARRAVYHFAEVASGSSAAVSGSVVGSSSAFIAGGSSVHTLPVSGVAPEVSVVEDYYLVSGGVLVDKPCSPLSEGQALVVDVSASSPPELSMLAEKEVGVSMADTSSAAALGVLGDVSSPSPYELMVVLTTSASSVTYIEVKESPTVPVSVSLGGPKKLLMSRYITCGTSSSGMPSSTSSGSGLSIVPLSPSPVGMGIVLPLAPGAIGGGIGERLAALLNRGLPPSSPPDSESDPRGDASSSGQGRGRGRRKRKRKIEVMK